MVSTDNVYTTKCQNIRLLTFYFLQIYQQVIQLQNSKFKNEFKNLKNLKTM